MDFDDTPDEAAFRQEARAFLSRFAEPRAGSDLAFRNRYAVDAQTLARARAWQALKAEWGFAGITWPERFGGRGLSPVMQVIYGEEEQRFAVPQGVFEIGLAMCVPTVMAYAAEEIADLHARRALRGETIWCQLFSEPSAGSDLAGLTTRADRDGDGWLINGQKTWTSVAHEADLGLLLARSDRDAPKHAGLTAFILDMKAEGVEVRPIRQMSGHSHFNDVFFTDVRIPDAARLGEVGGGWGVANTTLSNERYATGQAPGPHFDDAWRLACETWTPDGPAIAGLAIREQLADWYVRSAGLKYTRARIVTALSRGETPGPEAAIGKLVGAQMLQEITAFGLDLMGMAGGMTDPATAPMRGWFQDAFLYAPANRLAGGSDEILRNIIAERVLGLPAEPRVDRGVPFKDLPAQ